MIWDEGIYPVRQTEGENCQRDHRQELRDYIETAMDLVAESMDHHEPTVLSALWREIIICLGEARHHALCALAHEAHAMILSNQNRGQKCCAACKRWFPIDDLTLQQTEHNARADKRGANTWLTCRDCTSKLRLR